MRSTLSGHVSASHAPLHASAHPISAHSTSGHAAVHAPVHVGHAPGTSHAPFHVLRVLWPASGVRAGPRVYRAPARVSWPAPRVAPWVASTFPRTIETLLAGVATGRRIVVGP